MLSLPELRAQCRKAIRNGQPDLHARYLAAIKTREAELAAARAASAPASIARLEIGQSDLFTQYVVPGQLSTAIAKVSRTLQRKFRCVTEYDLIEGEKVAGIRVVRAK
jgi:hypothetical protein